VRLCDELSSSGYNPVGDICHQLFYVHPPPGVPVNATKAAQLRRAMDEVNASLLNVSVEQLQSVKELYIVAGTERKAAAARELVAHGGL